MKTWVRKTLSVGVLAAGALLFGSGVAHADVRQDSNNNNGILNGTQLVAPIDVPLNVVGNAIGVAGEANASGAGWNHWLEGGKVTQKSHHNNGILNGTQVYVPVDVPVNIVGNAIAVLGQADAAGAGVNKTERAPLEHGNKRKRHGVSQSSHHNNGIGNGTQIYAPVDIPINICGNSFALLGAANTKALCVNRTGRTESATQDSNNNNGIGNGTQVYAPTTLALNLAGNAVGFLGEGNAAAMAMNESGHGDGVMQNSHHNNGILNGAQVAAPVRIPINICGNALAILGAANAHAACANGDAGGHHGGGNGGGHHGGGGNGGDNGGAHGGGDYLGDGGSKGDGYGGGASGGYDGAGGAGGDYGDGRSATEGSAVDSLTNSAGNLGSVGLGGLDLLKVLN